MVGLNIIDYGRIMKKYVKSYVGKFKEFHYCKFDEN